MVWIALLVLMLVPETAQAIPFLAPIGVWLGATAGTAGAATLGTFAVASVASTVATTVAAFVNQPKFPDVPTPGDVEAAARAGASMQVRQREKRQTQTVYGGETFLADTVVIEREPLGPIETTPTEIT